jgi:hypothetical protein
VFCILMFGSLSLAASRALTLKDPTLITFAYVGIASVVTSLVFCYVDLGLTNGRVTTFLGVVLGVLAVLRRIEQEDPPPEVVKATEEAESSPPVVETVGAARRGRRPAWFADPDLADQPVDDDPADAWPDAGRPAPERPDFEPTPAGVGRA